VTIEHQPETGGRIQRNGHTPEVAATAPAEAPDERAQRNIIVPALLLLLAVFLLRKLI
jgi:hypothetical protein